MVLACPKNCPRSSRLSMIMLSSTLSERYSPDYLSLLVA
jgi:hypothetical protein